MHGKGPGGGSPKIEPFPSGDGGGTDKDHHPLPFESGGTPRFYQRRIRHRFLGKKHEKY